MDTTYQILQGGQDMRSRSLIWAAALLLVVVLVGTGIDISAFKVKDTQAGLDDLAFTLPECLVSAGHSDFDEARDHADARVVSAFDRFTSLEAGEWRAVFDEYTGKFAFIEGSGIPWIPGTANDLTAADLGLPAEARLNQVPVEIVEALARGFMDDHPELLDVNPEDLRLRQAASGPILDYLYFVDFQWTMASPWRTPMWSFA
jgi:hypothetical protein